MIATVTYSYDNAVYTQRVKTGNRTPKQYLIEVMRRDIARLSIIEIGPIINESAVVV